MRHNKKAKRGILKTALAASILLLVIAGVALASLRQDAQPKPVNPETRGIALEAPPPDVYDPDFGVPLNTTDIGLFAYYYEASGWTLNNTVPAWQNYTDHGTHYDGYIRVWIQVYGTTYEGSGYYVDLYARVRGDGWVMVWMDKTLTPKTWIVYWASATNNMTNPLPYSISVFRAMERIYYVAGVAFPTYANIKLYDYQYSTATRLLIFGKRSTGTFSWSDNYYAVFPSTTTSLIGAVAIAYASVLASYTNNVDVNGNRVITMPYPTATGWANVTTYLIYDGKNIITNGSNGGGATSSAIIAWVT